jgi:DNA-binding NarL/FixJ family response regulator
LAVAESSEVIRAGIISLLKKVNNIHIDFFEIKDSKQLKQSLNHQQIDILIVNPLFISFSSLQQIKNEALNPDMKIIALQTVLCDSSAFLHYDEQVTLYNTSDQIKSKVTKLILTSTPDKPSEMLSSREKEIISYVIKGMANKQIADKLCLSVHTVVTHRRNIANKLDIHSTSGLTIYAIVNKLVEIEDLDKN